MRAKELTLTEWSYIDPEITSILLDKGYELLGRGVDQLAFWEPSTGQILKVFGAAKEGIDPMLHHKLFETWVEYCGKHKNNPFLPKYSAWAPFNHKGHRYLQIRMERLVPAPHDWDAALETFANFVELTKSSDLEQFKARRFNYDNRWLSPSQYRGDEELAVHLGDEGLALLLETMLDVMKVGHSNGWIFDLHAGNFMMRRDSTPVILDPWVERSGRHAAMPKSNI
jgi:hypothetical protein